MADTVHLQKARGLEPKLKIFLTRVFWKEKTLCYRIRELSSQNLWKVKVWLKQFICRRYAVSNQSWKPFPRNSFEIKNPSLSHQVTEFTKSLKSEGVADTVHLKKARDLEPKLQTFPARFFWNKRSFAIACRNWFNKIFEKIRCGCHNLSL